LNRYATGLFKTLCLSFWVPKDEVRHPSLALEEITALVDAERHEVRLLPPVSDSQKDILLVILLILPYGLDRGTRTRQGEISLTK